MHWNGDLNSNRRQFQRDGYQYLTGILSPPALEELHSACSKLLTGTNSDISDISVERNCEGHFLLARSASSHTDNFIRLLRQHVDFASIAELLGVNKHLVLLDDQIFLKGAHTKSITPWHWDQQFWAATGTQLATLWITLNPTNTSRAGLQFIKGSHRWEKKANTGLFDSYSDTDLTSTLSVYQLAGDVIGGSAHDRGQPMNAGDALLFDASILHGAEGNRSNADRLAYVVRLAGEDSFFHINDKTAERHSIKYANLGLKVGDRIGPDNFPLLWQNMA